MFSKCFHISDLLWKCQRIWLFNRMLEFGSDGWIIVALNYHGLNIVFPQNFYVETYILPNMIVLGCGTFWDIIRFRWGHDEISVLIRVTRELASPFHSPPCQNKMRSWQSATWKRVLTRTQLYWHLTSDFSPPELWEINVRCFISHSVYGSLLQQPEQTKIST